MTSRFGGDRQELRELAEMRGFHTRAEDTRDPFQRGPFSVEVYYEGDAAVHARRIHDGKQIGFPFSDRSARTAAVDWLIKTPSEQV